MRLILFFFLFIFFRFFKGMLMIKSIMYWFICLISFWNLRVSYCPLALFWFQTNFGLIFSTFWLFIFGDRSKHLDVMLWLNIIKIRIINLLFYFFVTFFFFIEIFFIIFLHKNVIYLVITKNFIQKRISKLFLPVTLFVII